ncbi:MAG: pilus assembly protein N-terminal domain-containing protein, partial [Proteobacteria bacterium]|nr:pilus assembly protein N-terminal domain-containing protein [Pseudomonadota bacterium]
MKNIEAIQRISGVVFQKYFDLDHLFVGEPLPGRFCPARAGRGLPSRAAMEGRPYIIKIKGKYLRFSLFPVLFIGFLFASPVLAQETTIRLTVGQSVILDFPQLKQVAVGDATIADVKVVSGRQQVMVTGLVEGSTNLTIWLEEGKKLSRLIRVFTRDPEVILRDVKALLKDAEGVNVRVVGDKVVIEGETLS